MKINHQACILSGLLFSIFALPAEESPLHGTIVGPTGTYRQGVDGKYHPVTNVDVSALWAGVWKEDTNGLRVQLEFFPKTEPPWVRLEVGSIISNSFGEYVGSPSGRFMKFELKDSNGAVVPFASAKSIEGPMPLRIASSDLPRVNHSVKNHIGFVTNGGPTTISVINLGDLYHIANESDYKLTVCAVIYKFETNVDYLDRVDLPCVTANIHIKAFPEK